MGTKELLYVTFRNKIRKNNVRVQYMYVQEGQHPLTGQRAANVSLLANQ